jgi:hypothetical protein
MENFLCVSRIFKILPNIIKMNYLSKKNGNPIAIYKVDEKRKLIKLSDKKDDDTQVASMYEYIKEKDMTTMLKGLSTKEVIQIERSIQQDTPPTDSRMLEVYDRISKRVNNSKDREMTSMEGDYVPYPKRNDILFLIGATGSGKSTSIKRYLIEFKRIYPEVKKIFLFTDVHQEDPELAGLGIKKIQLDMSIVENPIEPHELANSVCIFDDVDSISDKKILKAIITLKGSVCKQGVSKNGITCVITNHNATEGLSTKNAINECKYLYLYPMGGTTGLNYLLRTKLGLSKEQFMKITQLKSRVVILHKRCPFYVIHSHGIFLL